MNITDKNFSCLSSDEVKERINKGQNNVLFSNNTKTVKQIFKDNLLTFFNILNLIFAVLIICTGTPANLAFMIVVIFNLAIGLIQELSAKKTLDRLSLIVESKTEVIRDNKVLNVSVTDIVIDDIIVCHAGDQICADAIVIDGNAECNESLITGESDNITKNPGDSLFSGSYLISGKVYAKVTAVGYDSFSGKLSKDAKSDKALNSELMRGINAILKSISVIIVPIGLFIFLKQNFITQLPLNENIVAMVAALISMIPEGLVLLTSMALASSSIILSYKKTLVQNLYAAENLARVNVVCFDKTGTLTTGNLKVINIIKFNDYEEILGNYINCCEDNNSTFNAIKQNFKIFSTYNMLSAKGFSSQRKYSCISFRECGTVYIGAYDILFKNNCDIFDTRIISKERFVAVAVDNNTFNTDNEPADLKLLAIIIFQDEINHDVKNTIEYLNNQEVNIYIMTGDSTGSLRKVADEIGINISIFDLSQADSSDDYNELTDKYNAFCRVLPEQKKTIIQALQKKGNTVAMVGDGVNDVPALKCSDCSIAMANGSDIARNISDVVQLSSDFSSMPSIINEGRRVINNIQRVAALFTTKTIYSILISILTLIIPASIYPFNPLQLTIISFITIGFPAFFLSFEPNKNRIKGNFIANTLKRSIPGGLCIFIIILVINIINSVCRFDYATISSATFIIISFVGLFIIAKICWPLTKIRLIILLATAGITCAFIFIPPLSYIAGIVDMPIYFLVFIAVSCISAPFIILLFEKWFSCVIDKLVTKLIQRNRTSK